MHGMHNFRKNGLSFVGSETPQLYGKDCRKKERLHSARDSKLKILNLNYSIIIIIATPGTPGTTNSQSASTAAASDASTPAASTASTAAASTASKFVFFGNFYNY